MLVSAAGREHSCEEFSLPSEEEQGWSVVRLVNSAPFTLAVN